MARFNTFGMRIASGFIVVTTLLVLAVSLTLWKVDETAEISNRVTDYRMPITNNSHALLNGVNHSLASMRGFIISGDDEYKMARKDAWNTINKALDKLKSTSQRWKNAQSVQKLQQVETKIEKLARLQNQMEGLTDSSQERALAVLKNETAPLASDIREIMEELVGIQDHLLEGELQEVRDTTSALKMLQWLLLIFGVLIAGLTGFFITRDVTVPLARTVEASERIAREDFDFEVDLKGPLEIGVLRNALEKMRVNLKNLTHGLREKNQTLENKQWQIDGQVGLLEVMGGDQGIKSLAGNILSFLTPRMNGLMSAFYLVEGSFIKPVEGFGWQDNEDFYNTKKIKDGLVGQTVKENKLKIIQDIPRDYFKIKSGLGEMVPSSLLFLPVSFDDQVVAVLEFATHGEFSPESMELLEQTSQNIGIALNLSLSSQKTKELLEETQVQTEELQAQEEELRASNEELELKTKSLEASEEELKNQQEELKSVNEELEEQTVLLKQEKVTLSGRTGELEQAKRALEFRADEIEQVSRYKSEFLANMSHELRTPLNSILMLSQTLSENRTKNFSEKQLQAVNTIHSSGADLLDLIEDILDLSKVEAGKLDVKSEEVDISDLCYSITDGFEPMAMDQNLACHVDLKDGVPPTFFTDPIRIKQILKNLLSNAFKFTNNGSVTLSVYRPVEGGRFYDPLVPNLCFEVKDTGIGIPEEEMKSVFEAFKQLDAKTTRKYSGTGLGLSIVRELVALLGAKIELESEIEKGTIVTICLPEVFSANPIQSSDGAFADTFLRVDRSEYGKVQINVSDDREDIQSSDSVVLIVEDDLSFANSLLDLCRENGFKGVILSDGISAMKLAEEILPKGILLDLSLPDLDGESVLKLLKQNPKTRHIPVQVITGHDRSKEVLDAGAIGFLRKPVQREEIDTILQKIARFSDLENKIVLIVEDDSIQRKSIREYIEVPGIEVIEAETGEEGLEFLAQRDIACVILDLKLNDISGKEFLKQAKVLDHKFEMPPVIIYTGKDLDNEDIKELERDSRSIIVKGARSPERLFDETMMFLHRLQDDLPDEKKKIVENLHEPARILKGKKILVVDDDSRNIISLRHLLEDHDVRVVEAQNGREALETLEKEQGISLILMDMMMPEMDGYEATRLIRESARYQTIPVIALTARAMRGERDKCLEAGCSDYMSKPVENDKLISLLRVWLYKQR